MLQYPLYMDSTSDIFVSGGLGCIGISMMGTVVVIILAMCSKTVKCNIEESIAFELKKFLLNETNTKYGPIGYTWSVGEHFFWLEL